MPNIIPKKNIIVPDPERGNTPLPEEGRFIEDLHQYWYRRQIDGDILVLDDVLIPEPKAE